MNTSDSDKLEKVKDKIREKVHGKQVKPRTGTSNTIQVNNLVGLDVLSTADYRAVFNSKGEVLTYDGVLLLYHKKTVISNKNRGNAAQLMAQEQNGRVVSTSKAIARLRSKNPGLEIKHAFVIGSVYYTEAYRKWLIEYELEKKTGVKQDDNNKGVEGIREDIQDERIESIPSRAGSNERPADEVCEGSRVDI